MLIVWTTSIRCSVGLEILTKRIVWEKRSEGVGKESAERTRGRSVALLNATIPRPGSMVDHCDAS